MISVLLADDQGLVRAGVDLEQGVALLDQRPLLERHLLEVAGHALVRPIAVDVRSGDQIFQAPEDMNDSLAECLAGFCVVLVIHTGAGSKRCPFWHQIRARQVP